MRDATTIRTDEAGHAIVEIALMAPWIFLLFAAIFDFGFYAYAMIATSNAARVAVLHTSSSAATKADSAAACAYVLAEFKMMPNVASGDTCACAGANCSIGAHATVKAEAVNGPDSIPGQPPIPASKVTVTYDTIQLFPLPWLTGKLHVQRVAEMRVMDN